jgi:anti-anti-sigma regulatory factor
MYSGTMADVSNPDFTMTAKQGPNGLVLTLSGTITEETELTAPATGGQPVVLDVEGVRRMNSMGVSAWIKFVAALTAQSPVVVRRMSPMLVTQASMITSFVGRATVESFLSPWVCPSCDHTLEQLHGYQDPLPESMPCPTCGTAMELDWDRDAYLAFRES